MLMQPRRISEFHIATHLELTDLGLSTTGTDFKFARPDSLTDQENFNLLAAGYQSNASTNTILTSSKIPFKVNDQIVINDSPGVITNIRKIGFNSIKKLNGIISNDDFILEITLN